jgi:hypothetical protein
VLGIGCIHKRTEQAQGDGVGEESGLARNVYIHINIITKNCPLLYLDPSCVCTPLDDGTAAEHIQLCQVHSYDFLHCRNRLYLQRKLDHKRDAFNDRSLYHCPCGAKAQPPAPRPAPTVIPLHPPPSSSAQHVHHNNPALAVQSPLDMEPWCWT